MEGEVKASKLRPKAIFRKFMDLTIEGESGFVKRIMRFDLKNKGQPYDG